MTKGLMTRTHWSCLMEPTPAEKAMMGDFGLYLAVDTALFPVPLKR